MGIAITDLVTPVTTDEALAELLSLAASVGLPTTSWQSGQPLRTLLVLVAQKIADQSQYSAEIASGGFGDLLPSDDWADLWAKSRFNVDRVVAVAATGLVNLTNTSANTYNLNPGDLIVAHSVTGKTYRNVNVISVIPGGLNDVNIQADEVGTASNAAPGAITKLVSSLTGVGVTNPASVLGTDKETTAALVLRARAKLGALSAQGPKGIYSYIATTPAYSATATAITRATPVTDPATGLITLYLAYAADVPVAGDVAIVQAAIDKWAEPWCVTATAAAATPLTQNVTYQVWIANPTQTSEEIKVAIDNAIATFFSELPIGGYVIPPDNGALYLEALRQVIGKAVANIQQVAVTVPAADVALTDAQVAILGAITSTITILT